MSLPVVAIVGRPNVGKSTLFNRIVGKGLAVVDDTPGITRDRHYAMVDWSGVTFHLVDTGGWVPEGAGPMERRIIEQVARAIEECDLVLLIVDAREGLTPDDERIAKELRRRGSHPLLVANKVDSEQQEGHALEFASLGIEGSPWPISAIVGRGMGDFLDEVVRRLPRRATPVEDPDLIRVAILGRPNVGKSSLANRLLGDERMIVDEAPGTTRDAIEATLRYHGRKMVLVDTAGIRRKLGSQPSYEFYATLRAIRSIDSADVVVLVLDATEPISRQDLRIARLIDEAGRPCVWVFNKWDLVSKDERTSAHMLVAARKEIPFQSYAPAEFVSALTAQRVSRIPERVMDVYEAARIKVPTADLNARVKEAVEKNPPRAVGGTRPVRIYYATQVRVAPPTFSLFVSQPHRLAKEYERYLTRALRDAFGFVGSPIRLQIRKSG